MSKDEKRTNYRAASRRSCEAPAADGSMRFWRMHQLWELAEGLPVRKVRLSELDGFDEVRWFGGPRNILPTCRAIAEHARDILECDLSYPIILSPEGEVLDGWHRICKAYLERIEELDAVQLTTVPPFRWRVLITGEEVEILLNFRLIHASPQDEAWLENLRRNVYQELFYATWGGWDEGRHTRHFSDCLARGHIFIIEEDGTRVGMIQILEEANAVEVAEIQVQPEAQSRGVGTAVLKDVIARAHESRKSVQLRVGLKNERAYKLYERLGFRCVNQTETHNHMVCEPNPKA